MIHQTLLKHPIQRHIVDTLTYKDVARFSELRPPNVDTNLVTYHLKLLIQKCFVLKIDKAYSLDARGLAYIDQATSPLEHLPRVISMLLVQNSDGRVLLKKLDRQPYIDTWTLPFGDMRSDDASITQGSERVATEQLGLGEIKLKHAGDCYIRVHSKAVSVSTHFIHVFRGEVDKEFDDDLMQWVEPRKLVNYTLAPAIERVIARSFFGDEHFFEEFEHEWSAIKL